MFVSVHGFGPRDHNATMPCATFYPGTGKTCVPNIPSAAEHSDHVHSDIAPSETSPDISNPDHVPIVSMSDEDDEDDDQDDYQLRRSYSGHGPYLLTGFP